MEAIYEINLKIAPLQLNKSQYLSRIEGSPPKVTLQRSPWKNLSWELSPIITEADKKIKYVPIAQLDRAHAS